MIRDGRIGLSRLFLKSPETEVSELMQLLTGAKPYPIPACAIRPMPLLEAEGADDEPCECSSCKRPGLTAADFYHSKGRRFSRCKRCFCEAKNAKRRDSK